MSLPSSMSRPSCCSTPSLSLVDITFQTAFLRWRISFSSADIWKSGEALFLRDCRRICCRFHASSFQSMPPSSAVASIMMGTPFDSNGRYLSPTFSQPSPVSSPMTMVSHGAPSWDMSSTFLLLR